MKNLDILQASDGSQLRIILYAEPQSYVVDCQRFRMPSLVRNADLAAMQTVSADQYAAFVLDDDLSPRQRAQRDKRFSLLDGLLCSQAITDKAYRSRTAQEQATLAGVTRRTVLLYLWRYWVSQNKNALLTSSCTEHNSDHTCTLSVDEKNIRWALNKFYYTPQKQTLTTAYKMMLQARYCDAYGKLLPQYPSFWQFRYYFRCHRDPINETISRQGIKAYQRNHRAFTGSVRAYAETIGTYMTDATVADIYIVSRITRKPIGRPIIYTMVDAYSNLITGVYVGLEGEQYALRLLMQNTCADKVSVCHKYGIEIDPQDWPSHHLPSKIITDRGTEFLGGPLENLCECYHIEVENLPSYRPDLKGPVEKLFDLIQSAYKPLLKGKGIIEPDYQERGAPDYRKQGVLDIDQFTRIVLKCVIYYNSRYIMGNFPLTTAMMQVGVPPIAARIWTSCPSSSLTTVDSAKLGLTLLPRADGRITQHGLEVFALNFSNALFKKRFVKAGLSGREKVVIAYNPACLDSIWLFENGEYTEFRLMQDQYRGKTLAEVQDAQQTQKKAAVDWKKQDLQAQLDLMADISAIASMTERPTVVGNIGKQIAENRPIARKQESTNMMDLLFDMQEDL